MSAIDLLRLVFIRCRWRSRERLEHPLHLLTGGERDRLHRQQTMRIPLRGVMTFSPKTSSCFFGTFIFASGCTLEAIGAISAPARCSMGFLHS